MILLGWLAREPQGPTCLCFLIAGITCVLAHLACETTRLLGTELCLAGTLLIESSLQLWRSNVEDSIGKLCVCARAHILVTPW